jgi:hypothetical protein
MVLADIAGTTPPSPDENRDDFGFHHEYLDVKLVTLCAELWGWTPQETMAQSEAMLWDMLRYRNLTHEVQNPDNPTVYVPPDTYEDQPESDVRKLSL